MYNFISLDFNTRNGLEYLPKILLLFDKHKKWLCDDYFPADCDILIEKIKKLSPHFFAVTNENNEFAGFMYASNFISNGNKIHSCHISGCASGAFLGKETRKIFKQFMNLLYQYGIIKLYAMTNVKNRLCINILKDCGFKKEGWFKGYTLIDNKLVDFQTYGKLRKDVL